MTDLRELVDKRDRLLQARVAGMEIGANPTQQHLLACALEMAPVAGLLEVGVIRDPVRQAVEQIASLSGEAPTPASARRHR
jgi:hypothetical protein